MKILPVSMFTLATFGCSSPTQSTQLELTKVIAIIEEFNPNALVVYGTGSPLPYDAESRTSKIRVISPKKLADRTYTIDLLQTDEKDGYKDEALKIIGQMVALRIPKDLVQSKEKEMLPIYRLTIEPIQRVDTTAAIAPRLTLPLRLGVKRRYHLFPPFSGMRRRGFPSI